MTRETGGGNQDARNMQLTTEQSDTDMSSKVSTRTPFLGGKAAPSFHPLSQTFSSSLPLSENRSSRPQSCVSLNGRRRADTRQTDRVGRLELNSPLRLSSFFLSLSPVPFPISSSSFSSSSPVSSSSVQTSSRHTP